MMAKGFFSAGNLFKPRAAALIGVDISATSVKLVELGGSTLAEASVLGYIIEPLPRDAVVDGNINNLDVVAEAIKRAKRKLGSRTKAVATSLPTGMVITKRVILPADLREEDLEIQVEADANQYIPFPLDEVNLDFQVLGPAANGENEIEVLLAGARKEKIEDRVAAVESAGFKAKVVDIDGFAVAAVYPLLVQQLPGQGKNQNVAVFDIGAHATRLYVYRNGDALFSRENPFGGNQLTQDIQRAFNMTPEEAEAAKLSGGLPSNFDNDVLKPFIDTLAIELTRSLQFFFSSTSQTQVDHIFLGGGCARVSGLIDAVGRRSNVTTSLANPFAKLAAGDSARMRELAHDAPALLIASGLALRRFPE